LARAAGKTLVFDADDTLWENNVLFERVIDDFMDWLAHPTLDTASIRSVFNDIEVSSAVGRDSTNEASNAPVSSTSSAAPVTWPAKSVA